MSLELCFYLAAPWLVRNGARRMALAMAAGLALRLGFALAGPEADRISHYLLPTELYLFMAGALSWRAYEALRHKPWLRRLGLPAMACLTAMVLGYALLPAAWRFAAFILLLVAAVPPGLRPHRRQPPGPLPGRPLLPLLPGPFPGPRPGGEPPSRPARPGPARAGAPGRHRPVPGRGPPRGPHARTPPGRLAGAARDRGPCRASIRGHGSGHDPGPGPQPAPRAPEKRNHQFLFPHTGTTGSVHAPDISGSYPIESGSYIVARAMLFWAASRRRTQGAPHDPAPPLPPAPPQPALRPTHLRRP